MNLDNAEENDSILRLPTIWDWILFYAVFPKPVKKEIWTISCMDGTSVKIELGDKVTVKVMKETISKQIEVSFYTIHLFMRGGENSLSDDQVLNHNICSELFMLKKDLSIRDILIALYKSTNGDKWNSNRGWNYLLDDNYNNNQIYLYNLYHNVHLLDNDDSDYYLLQSTFFEISIKILSKCSKLPSDMMIPITKIRTLNLGVNNLTGDFPPEICMLTNLQYIDLTGNKLTGNIPTRIEKLTNLNDLRLGNNQLTGIIPKELSQLTNLSWVELNNNQLSGSIPPELGQLTRLNWLNLSKNQLSGTVPSQLLEVNRRMRIMDLSNNLLTGEVPPSICNQ